MHPQLLFPPSAGHFDAVKRPFLTRLLRFRHVLLVWSAAVLAVAAGAFAAQGSGEQARVAPPGKVRTGMDKKRLVLGWYMGSMEETGRFASIANNTDALSVVSPTWFRVTDADSNTVDSREPALSALCGKVGVSVWPLIANGDFTWDNFHPLIAEPVRREKLVAKIVELMKSCEGCQGINLDFEGINPEDRAAYTAFVRRVSEELHARGYLVTIDVPAKTHDDPSARWPGAFDYVEIGKLCDYVMLMIYDENVPGGSPGPVGSVGWDDRVLAYAKTVIPKEKILMGIPFYGYDWAEDNSAFSFLHESVIDRIEKAGAEVQWDEESQTPWFSYTDPTGGKRTAYFENCESVAAKLKIAARHDAGGICIWSLGGEDPAIWGEIRKYRGR